MNYSTPRCLFYLKEVKKNVRGNYKIFNIPVPVISGSFEKLNVCRSPDTS